MTTLRDQRESGQLFDELERIIKEQDEQIQALQRTNENFVMQLKHAILESRKWQSLHPVGTFAYDSENEVWEQLVPDEAGIELYALKASEPPFKISDTGADTNITRGLEPKGEGMVVLHQREWVGLTDDVLNSLVEKCAKYYGYEMKPIQTAGFYALVKAIEAKLKEKNT